MCGRYSLFEDLNVLEEMFEFEYEGEIVPRYNIAPSQKILAIIGESGKRKGREFRWGLIPPWSKDIKIGYKMINARSETIAEKPSFKKPFESKRCLIPCTGYYEWKKEESGKQPYFFYLSSKEPFAFAGLYDVWKNKEETIVSCTILTCSANEKAQDVHDRMPVILKKKDQEAWLSSKSAPADLQELFKPYPSKEMDKAAVSQLVNSPKNETAEILAPLNSK
ncbi:SOS response-associated peptidase [Metabacillus sp. GX 13764]|uniref:SOS response-associated peptidase n=1 Tax=Metabacillus kandeliae TaxID=2900151 RepID=UPI001E4CCEB1|nr:SOS response-associated peptidase [Metabacillus kandeliae]MCD7035829.1 SOS response-associated peptidase [Metabacillus kandeliae]